MGVGALAKTGAVVGAVVAAVVCSAVALAPVASADTWTMPDLIGVDLQGAQDAIQSLTDGSIWYSGSTDLTGQDRMQVNDRAWVVCTSSPAPGAQFSESTPIDFGVVRKDVEDCPGR